MNFIVEKIISGGQTGADRAALDFAIRHGIPHGGWCPRGRRAEDGVIPLKYELREASSSDYWTRTKLNVQDSTGTALITQAAALSVGTASTGRYAKELGKPCVHVHGENSSKELREWILKNNIRILNVAGPRASNSKFIWSYVTDVLTHALLK